MTHAGLVLLELDPNVVRPGWTALLVVAAIGVVLVFLFLSMRKQFRKINARTYEGDLPPAADAAPAEPPTDSARPRA